MSVSLGGNTTESVSLGGPSSETDSVPFSGPVKGSDTPYKGEPGKDGKDGSQGPPGPPGPPGANGINGIDGQTPDTSLFVQTGDARLLDQRTPKPGSVNDSKIDPAGLSPETIRGLAAALLQLASLGSASTHDAADFEPIGAAATARDTAKAYADSLINSLRGASPALIDTLVEIDNAIGNDPNFAATMATALTNRVLITDPRLTDTRTPTDGTVTDAKIGAGGLSQSSINGLVTLLGGLAADANVVHLTNAETIAGSKTFTGTIAAANGLNLGKAIRTANVTLSLTSNTVQLCDATTAGFTVTLPATTAGMVYVLSKTDSTANAVVVASTDISGAASVSLGSQNDYLILIGTGTSGQWKIIGGTVTSVNARCKTTVYVTPGSTPTWTKDARAVIVEAEGIGGADGGGSGAVVASGTACSGGSAGSAGGYFLRKFIAATLPATIACSVGSGGIGGASVTGATSTQGNAPTAPTTTSFGASATYAAYASPNATRGKGGQINAAAAGTTNIGMFMAGAGPSGNNGAAGQAGTNTVFSGVVAPSAGSGGGISTTPAAFAGGAGGQAFGSAGTGGTAGAIPGGTGGNGTGVTSPLQGQIATGSAGAGGASSITGNGGAGGDGALYGAPGGGGGSCLVGNTSGKGGNGAQGILVVREWF